MTAPLGLLAFLDIPRLAATPAGSPLIARQVSRTTLDVNSRGMTLATADRACLIEDGPVELEAPSASLGRDPEVLLACLGGPAGHRAAALAGEPGR